MLFIRERNEEREGINSCCFLAFFFLREKRKEGVVVYAFWPHYIRDFCCDDYSTRGLNLSAREYRASNFHLVNIGLESFSA